VQFIPTDFFVFFCIGGSEDKVEIVPFREQWVLNCPQDRRGVQFLSHVVLQAVPRVLHAPTARQPGNPLLPTCPVPPNTASQKQRSMLTVKTQTRSWSMAYLGKRQQPLAVQPIGSRAHDFYPLRCMQMSHNVLFNDVLKREEDKWCTTSKQFPV
jgi:hypothetical protein